MARPTSAEMVGDDPIPLLAGQVSFFTQQYQVVVNPHELNMEFTLDLEVLDVNRAVAALHRVWLTHPELDVYFIHDGTTWVQRYCGVGPSVLVVELGTVPRDLRDPYVKTLTRKLHGTLDIHRGPLARFLILTDGESLQLKAAVHHLVTDGFGMNLLAQDLVTATAAAASSPRPDTNAARWSHRRAIASVIDYAQSAVIKAELAGWFALPTMDLAQLPSRPDVNRPGRAMVHHVKYLDYLLPADDYSRLMAGTTSSQGFGPDRILLAGLGYALTRIYRKDVLAEVLHNGRTYKTDPSATNSESVAYDLALPEEAQVAGGFMSVCGALILPIYSGQSVGSYVALVDERRRQRVNQGVSWGLLRFLSAPADMDRVLATPACVPQVSYNHVSVSDRDLVGPVGCWTQRPDEVNPLYVERCPDDPSPSDGWVTPFQLAVASSSRSARCSLIYFSSLYPDSVVQSIAAQFGLFLSEYLSTL